jgi:multimeric flavodoxin WrbA
MLNITVLGISGSPRKGNSLFLLNEALNSAKKVAPESVRTNLYSIKGKTFNPCIACRFCKEHDGECVHKDDFEELRQLWLDADVIIYSVPVYHMSIPGQLKCFIDRLGNSMSGKFRSQMPEGVYALPKLLKVIGTIAQGLHIFSGQEHTITDLINHTLMMQSIPVTGDLWESYIGAGGWTVNSIERDGLKKLASGDDLGVMAALKATRDIGRRAVELAMIVKSGIRASESLLKKDAVYHPLLMTLDKKNDPERSE